MAIKSCALEDLGVSASFWRGKRVLITGHTGFKGSWLCLWLQKRGALVAGYALPPVANASLFQLAGVSDVLDSSVYADIRDLERLVEATKHFQPEIVFHLAAQPLVRLSYAQPVDTFQINVMGAVNVLETVRCQVSCRVAVVITSDKCYANSEWVWGYRETDPVGGYDPYSSSKACVELVTSAYRQSYFEGSSARTTALASARAGNVIGGGDFAKDRLIPDVMAAVMEGRTVRIRSPNAIRPWQHVLEPLSGYLLLAERLWDDPSHFSDGWNFGPSLEDARSVEWILVALAERLGPRLRWEIDAGPAPHEAHLLTLDSTKARTLLGWHPHWDLYTALGAVTEWWQAYERREPLRDVVIRQIDAYESCNRS